MSEDSNPPSDSLPVPVEPAQSRWLTVLSGFAGEVKEAAFRLLTSNKQVSNAIGKLVGSGANYATVRIDRSTRPIQDSIEAKSAFHNALVKAATEKAINDPAIVDRMVDRLVTEELGKQENREGVAKDTLLELVADPPASDQTAGPSADFLNYFTPHAEKASSEEMRNLFARILAGEIRKPGSFSPRTMQFMALMDQELATQINRARNWLSGDKLLLSKAQQKDSDLLLIHDLNVNGILSTGLITYYEGNTSIHNRCLIDFGSHAAVFDIKPNTKITVQMAPLTTVGKQVMTLTAATSVAQYVEEFAISIFDDNASVINAGVMRLISEENGSRSFGGGHIIKRRDMQALPNSPKA